MNRSIVSWTILKILDFYPESNGKPLEDFKQECVIKLVF